MKKVLLFACAAFAMLNASAQIPNAGFENWSNTAGYNMPDGWGNLNPMTTSMSVYTAEKGTPGSPGASYLKLTSRTVAGMGVMPGIAATGNLNMSTMSVTGGFANSTRPANLTGNWQYMGGNGSDNGFVAAYLTRWNTTTMKRDTVASAVHLLSGMVMSWATFSIPFTYNKGFAPDSALIILSSSGMTPANNSYLYVDNLAFSGTVATTGVANTTSAVNLSIYPNPASSDLAVSFTSAAAKTYTLTLTDMLGKVIRSQEVSALQGQNKTTISTHGIAAGNYLLLLKSGTAVSVNRVTIQ